jgi:DNA primase
LKRTGRRFTALCPFHQEKTPSFTVTPEKQVFHCFGCGVGGDVFKFIQLREKADFREALAILATKAGIPLESASNPGPQDGGVGKAELERVNRWACRWFQQQFAGAAGGTARAYVAGRGITEESVGRFAIGYAPESWEALSLAARKAGISPEHLTAAGLVRSRDDGSGYDAFRNRLMFPICDVMDRIIGFGGRTLGDDQAKYINSPQNPLFDKGRCLYGLSTARQAFTEDRTAVVVEGYVDCLLAQQYGFGQAVATLGTALTADHVRLLRRYVDQVILVFDSDQAGQRAADNALQIFLTERLDVKLARVPEAKDPADLLQAKGAEAFRQVLTSAVDALEFKWNEVRQRYCDAATGSDRRRAIEDFLGLVASSADLNVCDPIQRGLILNQVGKLLSLSGEEVHRQLRIIGRRRAPAKAEGTSRPVRASDAATAAMRDLLEVIINDPGHYAAAAAEFDPESAADEELQEVARAVKELVQQQGGFSLAELISRFDSVDTASRILELQVAGERRGNFAETVDGAVRRLRELGERKERSQLVAELRSGDAPVPVAGESAGSGEAPVRPDPEQRSMLRAIGQKRGGVGRFAGHRHVAGSGDVPANPVRSP